MIPMHQPTAEERIEGIRRWFREAEAELLRHAAEPDIRDGLVERYPVIVMVTAWFREDDGMAISAATNAPSATEAPGGRELLKAIVTQGIDDMGVDENVTMNRGAL